jgi:hypothetical protein
MDRRNSNLGSTDMFTNAEHCMLGCIGSRRLEGRDGLLDASAGELAVLRLSEY